MERHSATLLVKNVHSNSVVVLGWIYLNLLRCEWASCEQMNMDNIQQIVKVLHACNRHT